MTTEPPPLNTGPPPPIPTTPNRGSVPAGHTFAILLSLSLGLFLADAVVSLLDDTLILLLDLHVLMGIRGILSLFALFMTIVTYCLMGVSPMVPKRLFLPLTLFSPLAGLAVIPFLIYFYDRIQHVAWVISYCQVILGLSLLYRVQGGFRWRWPLIAENTLEGRRFSWRNLFLFLLVNLFGFLPVVIGYLVLCAALAVDHFSEGFLALRPIGLTVQVRKYVRNDGKIIQLFPMSHVGETDFYSTVSQLFPTNSIILMEGVTDSRGLLTNRISYERMAVSLGIAEQQNEFIPSRGEMVEADVDVEVFATNTIDLLNLVMLIHAKGLNAETLQKLMQYSPPLHFEKKLYDDLLGKRNRHLLQEIQGRLSQSEYLVVPWGAAHMPGIARGIQRSGFRLDQTRVLVAIRFPFRGNGNKSAGKEGNVETSE